MKKERWRAVRQGKVAPIESVLPDSCKLPAAGYLARSKALIIDLFMIYMPILYAMTYLVIGSAAEFRDNDLAVTFSWVLYVLIVALCTAFLGQTPGMRALEIQIVDKEGNRPKFPLALLHSFLFLLSVFLFCGVAIPAIRRQRSTLHDWILHTTVIHASHTSHRL